MVVVHELLCTKLEKQGGFVLLDFVDLHKLDFTKRALGANLSSADVERGHKHGGDHAILVRKLPVRTSPIS
jgi:hypothetical protein